MNNSIARKQLFKKKCAFLTKDVKLYSIKTFFLFNLDHHQITNAKFHDNLKGGLFTKNRTCPLCYFGPLHFIRAKEKNKTNIIYYSFVFVILQRFIFV